MGVLKRIAASALCAAAATAVLAQSDDKALLEAAETGNAQRAWSLLRAGANPNVKNERGETALHLAAAGGRDEVARLLVEQGAYVNAQDGKGNTALHGAADGAHVEVVAFLLGVKVNRDTKNRAVETAADLARKRGSDQIVKLLEKR
jgi:ankyrin repeat protein